MATQTINGHATGALSHRAHSGEATEHYTRFAAMIFLSFVTMYILMYAMVDSLSNVFHNINQVYMAGLMAAPMAIIEIILMSRMYPNKKINAAILAGSVLMLALFWTGIRNQIAVGDKQFVRSMIPHHAGAILMCGQANLTDRELSSLCARIIQDQQKEIDQMKAIMARLER